MRKESEEIERLKRLRDRQIGARDPTIKDKQLHHTISARRKADRYTLKDAVKELQSKWTWMIGGAVIGLAFGVVFSSAIPGEWADVAGYFMIFAGAVVGRAVGAAVDSRSDDWGKR